MPLRQYISFVSKILILISLIVSISVTFLKFINPIINGTNPSSLNISELAVLLHKLQLELHNNPHIYTLEF